MTASPHDDYLTWCLAHPGTSHFVDAAGVRLHYLEWSGPADAPRLILVHGFTGHAHWWDFVAPALAQNFRVIAPDLSGMGDSGYRAEYSVANYADEIAAVIRHTGDSPATVIGHSFGGRCTILAAHAHPNCIERIIVVDTRVMLAEPDRKNRFNRELRRDKKRYADLTNAKSRFRLVPDEPGTPPRIFDHIATHSLKQEADAQGNLAYVWKFDEAVMERMPRPAVIDGEALPQLKVPMDFVCGEFSLVASPEHAQKVAASIPRGRGPIVIPAAHHHVPIGQPLALVAVLRALLA